MYSYSRTARSVIVSVVVWLTPCGSRAAAADIVPHTRPPRGRRQAQPLLGGAYVRGQPHTMR
jgi:hypothetical protein